MERKGKEREAPDDVLVIQLPHNLYFFPNALHLLVRAIHQVKLLYRYSLSTRHVPENLHEVNLLMLMLMVTNVRTPIDL